jgi:ketosteroid isomerase-like protein
MAVAALGAIASYGGACYASELDEVAAAYNGYHQAIASLYIAKIETFFAHDDTLIDKEPRSKTIAVGWEGARKDFKGLIAAYAELSITQTSGPIVRVEGDVAGATGMNRAEGKLKTGKSTGADIADSDVFRKRDGHWVVVSHVATVMQP